MTSCHNTCRNNSFDVAVARRFTLNEVNVSNDQLIIQTTKFYFGTNSVESTSCYYYSGCCCFSIITFFLGFSTQIFPHREELTTETFLILHLRYIFTSPFNLTTNTLVACMQIFTIDFLRFALKRRFVKKYLAFKSFFYFISTWKFRYFISLNVEVVIQNMSDDEGDASLLIIIQYERVIYC